VEGCIVKLSRSPDAVEDLINEASIYSILNSYNIACFLPLFFGLFRHQDSVALVLSDEGEPIARFGDLPLKDKYVYFHPPATSFNPFMVG
jgi:hypothetical protein